MLIVCPTCTTTYQIQPAALGEAGRSVRCTKCKNTWFATHDSVVQEAELIAATADQAPAPSNLPALREPSEADLPAGWTNSVPDRVIPPDDTDFAAEAERAIVIADAPPLVPHSDLGAPSAKIDPGEPAEVETIASLRTRQAYVERKSRRTVLQRVASLPMLIVTLLVILGAALQWRLAVVRTFPQTASLYAAIGLPVNLRGLKFENVKSTGEFLDGASVLVIEGTIVNPTFKKLDVPRMRFTLRNAAGHEVYAWSALPSKTSIPSGGELPFRTRLAAPPSDGRDVIVRFFNRRDVTAGIQ